MPKSIIFHHETADYSSPLNLFKFISIIYFKHPYKSFIEIKKMVEKNNCDTFSIKDFIDKLRIICLSLIESNMHDAVERLLDIHDNIISNHDAQELIENRIDMKTSTTMIKLTRKLYDSDFSIQVIFRPSKMELYLKGSPQTKHIFDIGYYLK